MPEGDGIEPDEDGFLRAWRYLRYATKAFFLLALLALIVGLVYAVGLFTGQWGGYEWR